MGNAATFMGRGARCLSEADSAAFSEKCHRCGGEELADVEQDEEEEAQRQREGAREETARQR